jgi:hypothetical protein
MSAAFDREALLDAFDDIGRAAVQVGTKLQIAVYGGSALITSARVPRLTAISRHMATFQGVQKTWASPCLFRQHVTCWP